MNWFILIFRLVFGILLTPTFEEIGIKNLTALSHYWLNVAMILTCYVTGWQAENVRKSHHLAI